MPIFLAEELPSLVKLRVCATSTVVFLCVTAAQRGFGAVLIISPQLILYD